MNTFLIYQQIGGFLGVTSEEVSAFLSQNKNQDVEIRINSVGGSVFEGIAIHNLLKAHNGKVNVVIDSLCASIATVIALGGDTITMNLGSMFMIHNPWSMAFGESEDFRKKADLLDKIKEELVAIYMTKFEGSEEELQQMMDSETWLTDKEAMKFGFVDSMEKELKISASIKYDLSKYFNSLPQKGNQMKNKKKLDSEIDSVKAEEKAEISAEAQAETEASEDTQEETTEEASEEKAEETSEEETTEETSEEETTEETSEEEASEESTEEEAEEEAEEAQAEVAPEIMNSANVQAYIQEQVKAGIQAEQKRQDEIKDLAFEGQEDLVKNLIEEGCSIEESALRIIEEQKASILKSGPEASASKEESEAQSLLKKMNKNAPKALNEGSGEEIESMESLKKAYNNSKDSKEKASLAQKMSKLKKEIASKQ